MPKAMRLRDHTSVGEEWADYLKAIIPAGASEIQIEECKRAFYAGAFVMFGLVTADSLMQLDDAGAVRRLLAIEKEDIAVVDERIAGEPDVTFPSGPFKRRVPRTGNLVCVDAGAKR